MFQNLFKQNKQINLNLSLFEFRNPKDLSVTLCKTKIILRQNPKVSLFYKTKSLCFSKMKTLTLMETFSFSLHINTPKPRLNGTLTPIRRENLKVVLIRLGTWVWAGLWTNDLFLLFGLEFSKANQLVYIFFGPMYFKPKTHRHWTSLILLYITPINLSLIWPSLKKLIGLGFVKIKQLF